MTILFSDNKFFSVDSVSDNRTNPFISHSPVQVVPEHVKYTFKTNYLASVMMFGLISSDGLKMPVVFIKSGQKNDPNEDIRTLENHVKPWINAHYSPDHNAVLQQDGAPPYISQKTQRWLQENLPKHWSKELWLPGSPYFSPLDYSIWA